jgi:hypothetical protein
LIHTLTLEKCKNNKTGGYIGITVQNTLVTTKLEADITINNQPLGMLRLAVRILNGHTWSAIDNNQIHKQHYTVKQNSFWILTWAKSQGGYFIYKTDRLVYLTSFNIFRGISVV